MTFQLHHPFKVLFIITFLNSALIHCLYTKYQVTELDTSDSTFLIELASWTSPNLISSSIKYSDCGGAYLIQGYNILGPGAQKNMYYQRVFTDLPTHNMIYLTFDTWVIDSVDAIDYFQVSFDGVVISGWTNGFTATKTEFLCGGTGRRDIPNVQTFITQAHSASSLTLKVISQCDQVSTDEAFGFKNFRLIFAQAPTITASTFCATPPTGYKLVQTAKACPCPIGQYLVYNTTACGSCDDACISCYGPTAQQCYECVPGYNFDGIQCVKCDSSCATCNGPNSDQCNTCPTGKVLYNSKYCVDASVCSSPLTLRVSILLCSAFRGLTTTTDVFGNLYCAYTCSTSQHLIWDGSCIDSCEFPLKQVTNATGKYCLLPCATPYEFYHEDTQVCTEECDTWVETRQGIYYVCGPTPYSLMRPLHYMRYLAIDMPDPFQNITVLRANNLLSLRASPSTFAKAKAKFVSLVIPAVFLRYGVSSSFLVNFLDDLILLAIVIIFAMIFVLLEVACKSMQCDVGQLLFERLRVFTGFNLPILLIAINAGDIVLFSSLEFRSFDSNNTNSTISLVVAVVMLVVVAILLLGSCWLSFQAYKVKNPERYHYIMPYIQFQAKWQGFQILFKGMRGDKWFTQMFFPIYCFRTILPMLWSAILYKDPLAQTIINSVVSIAILLYLYFTRPLRRRSSFLNVFIFELLLLVANLSSIVLVGLNKAMSLNEFAKTFFADLILVCNLGFSVLAVICLLFKISRAVDIALYFRKKHSLQQRSAWFQLFLIPFQQGGFGFEEVQIDRIVEGDLEETEMINPLTASA